jgi:hypothetical protein
MSPTAWAAAVRHGKSTSAAKPLWPSAPSSWPLCCRLSLTPSPNKSTTSGVACASGACAASFAGSVHPRLVHRWRAGHVEDALDADCGYADNDGHEDVALARTQLRLPTAHPLVFKDLELPADHGGAGWTLTLQLPNVARASPPSTTSKISPPAPLSTALGIHLPPHPSRCARRRRHLPGNNNARRGGGTADDPSGAADASKDYKALAERKDEIVVDEACWIYEQLR